MTNELAVNKLLVPADGASLITAPVRILDIDSRLRSILVITLQHPLKKPWVLNMDEVLEEIEDNGVSCVIATPAPHMLKLEQDISDSEVQSREQCWSLIKELVEGKNTGDLFVGGMFGSIVSSHANKKSVCWR